MSHNCRFCNEPLAQTLVNLGETPLAGNFLSSNDQAKKMEEKKFLLHVVVCNACWLVQTTETIPAEEIFHYNYAYLSSYSDSWVAHALKYAKSMVDRFHLGQTSRVVEVASNDGYLLQHFRDMGIKVLGVEPAGYAAELAEAKGIPTRNVFFNEEIALELKMQGVVADLMVANNVLAHVPDIRSFAAGFKVLLAPNGIATFEFPHLVRLLEEVQFDTIYHEHYSYLSLTFLERLMRDVGLHIFDVEELKSHGGSLRVFACNPGVFKATNNVEKIRKKELTMHFNNADGYKDLSPKVEKIINDFRSFIRREHNSGKKIACYGAVGKGNTFLNVAGITSMEIDFVVDRNPTKQGCILPGSGIPVLSPDEIVRRKPDYLVILPWNLAEEVMSEQEIIRKWSGKFVIGIPSLLIL